MKLSVIKYILLLCGVMPLLASCEDFLDKQESEDLTFDQIWEKQEYTYGYFLTAMSLLPDDVGSYVSVPWASATDELITASGVSGELINTGSWNASNVPWYQMAQFYRGIRECNIFMQNVDRCSDPRVTAEDKANWKHYTRWARAYYYFLMMRIYGPVFLLGDELVDFSATTEELYRPRNTWEECVNYVTSEMNICAEYFKANNQTTWQTDNDKGLPTAGAALAVISRLKLYSARPLFNGNTLYRDVKNPVTPDFPELSGVNLFPQTRNDNKWKEALDAAQAVLDLDVYELYKDKDDPTNPYANYIGITQDHWNKEIIWSTGYKTLGVLARRCAPSGLAGIAYGAIGPSQQQVDAYAMENGRYPITGYNPDGTPIIDETSGYTEEGKSKFDNPFAAWLGKSLSNPHSEGTWPNMYKGREPRFYMSVYWSDSYWKHGTTAAAYTLCSLAKGGNSYTSHDYSRGGYLLYRFYDHTQNSTTGVWGNIVFPTFRLGEIYLNYIEAALEWEKATGDGQYHAKAMELWAELRERVSLDPITDIYRDASLDDLIELCRKERRIELAYELHRYFDTRTWMIATTTDNGPIYGMNVEAKAPSLTETPDDFWQRTVMQNRVFKSNHYLYPFSQRELDRNKLLRQNYGW
ncbi:RagB/SusD family nutrient uptake outer membrane protein [uncultured Bacteroides sp.]|uniref:RagB/SusD family nutrient uptake outer membrane protein n=1 Tax=uncultured Bacteroides sp. TaxID=162156 RepID=UPI0025E1834E|nr:RagB/SusD family nutrient uptake outer membrane protein [uncultured Bacteroides sp.]